MEDDITCLERLIKDYRQRLGRQPSSWLELNHAGYIRGIPRDPTGAILKLTPEGRVQVQDPAKIPFLKKDLLAGQQPTVTLQKH